MPKKTNDKKTPQLLRGMKDILPEDQLYWDFIDQQVVKIAKDYGFERIDTPILEETSLFVRSVGKETDVVEKEMYSFEDKGGDNVSLRPEGTAPVARAYTEHGFLNLPQPVRLYYIGPYFRYDRPQAGRYRQFHQFGFEVFGDGHAVIDALLLMMVYNFYREIGLSVTLQVNSVGCPACRPDYRKALTDYFKTRRNVLCEDCKKRLVKNPLRILDCKEKDCQLVGQDAPQFVDHLCEECNSHFVKVLEQVDEVEVPYVLNSRLVRGLDYYTRTAFEIWPETKPGEQEEQLSQNALGGGGRYDNLIETLGDRPTPAIGYAGGIERLIRDLKENNISVPKPEAREVFVAQLGETARKKSLRLFEELRQNGIRVAENFSKDGIKTQMERADKLKVKFTVILGQKEIMDGTVLIRDMENGIQETVDYSKIISEVKKRLAKSVNIQNSNHSKEI